MTVWISREQIVNRVKDAGFRYRSEKKTTECFRRNAGDLVFIPKRTKLDRHAAIAILRQAGLTAAAVEAFLTNCTKG